MMWTLKCTRRDLELKRIVVRSLPRTSPARAAPRSSRASRTAAALSPNEVRANVDYWWEAERSAWLLPRAGGGEDGGADGGGRDPLDPPAYDAVVISANADIKAVPAAVVLARQRRRKRGAAGRGAVSVYIDWSDNVYFNRLGEHFDLYFKARPSSPAACVGVCGRRQARVCDRRRPNDALSSRHRRPPSLARVFEAC